MRQLVATSILTVALVLLIDAGSAHASWAIGAGSAASGQATSAQAPATPTGVTAACTSSVGSTVTVIWTAVAQASSYEIWESTTSATSGFSVLASGVTGTSWTSGSLATGSYWFEVSAFIGTNWTSPNSTASAKRTIAVALCA